MELTGDQLKAYANLVFHYGRLVWYEDKTKDDIRKHLSLLEDIATDINIIERLIPPKNSRKIINNLDYLERAKNFYEQEKKRLEAQLE